MEIIKKVNELQEEVMRTTKLKQEIKDILFENFINVPYKIVRINNKIEKKVSFKEDAYYPILNVPNGFSKEEETFLVMPSSTKNDIMYKYCLKDESGARIEITESTILSNIINNPIHRTGSYIELQFYIPTIKINYTVVVNKEVFSFSIEVNYKEILEDLVEDKIAIINDDYFEKLYYNASRKYKDFIKRLNIDEEEIREIDSLKKIINKKKSMYSINTSNLCFDIFVIKLTNDLEIPYYTTQFSANVCYKNCETYIIDINVSRKNLTQERFVFILLDGEECLSDKIFLNEFINEVLAKK